MRLSRRHFTQTLGSGITLSSAAANASMAAVSAATSFAGSSQSSEKPRIRIGQIGTTHAHANKLSVYRNSIDYEVVGIVEPDEERRKKAEAQPLYQNLNWMTQEQLLNVPGLQAVLVETDVRDLLTAAEACVSAGKHVHIDKPAGESLAHLTRILDSASKQQLMVQMGYMFRYNPGVVLLRQFLQQGWLGEIFEVHAVMSKVVDPVSRRGMAEYPGGIMFELGCHVIDLVIGVLGKPTNIAAFPRQSGSQNDGLLDNMLAVFEYAKATASIRSSAIEIDGGERRQLTVCGTEGTFHIQPLDNPSARITLSKPTDAYKAGSQTVTFPKYVRYVDDAADMAQVIRREKKFLFSPAHDLNVQTAVLQSCGLPID